MSDAKTVTRLLREKNKRFIAKANIAMRQGMQAFESKIIKEQMTGRPGLRRQTGTLARSWSVRNVSRGPEDYGVLLATSVKYARIHQYGGTIKPKTAGALTVPISRSARGAFARSFGNLFIARTRKGAVLARSKGRGLEAMYALKKSVRIPKRLHVIEDFMKGGKALIMGQILKTARSFK